MKLIQYCFSLFDDGVKGKQEEAVRSKCTDLILWQHCRLRILLSPSAHIHTYNGINNDFRKSFHTCSSDKHHNFNPKIGTTKQCYRNWLILFSLSTDNVCYSHFSFSISSNYHCSLFSYVLHSYHFLNFAVFEIWASIFYMGNSHRLAMLPASSRLLLSF